MTGDDSRPIVLAVDDEERVVQAFQIWLGEEYDVRTATGGAQALDQLDDTVDVVLLDRHMPGMSGDEVLERIREAEYDCRVAMVTAVAPEFDIVDMEFDHYVSKPVDETDLQTIVDRLIDIETYDQRLGDLYRVTQKIATLEAEMTGSRLDDHEEYAGLVEKRDRLREATHEQVGAMDTDDLDDVFEMIGSESP